MRPTPLTAGAVAEVAAARGHERQVVDAGPHRDLGEHAPEIGRHREIAALVALFTIPTVAQAHETRGLYTAETFDALSQEVHALDPQQPHKVRSPGQHQELLATSPVYRDIYESQMESEGEFDGAA